MAEASGTSALAPMRIVDETASGAAASDVLRLSVSTTTMSSSDSNPLLATAIEDKIFGLLATRREGATICPSEVARALVSNEDAWRGLMLQVRQVAQDLATNHRLHVTRGGVQVDATSRGGPIRLGLPIKRSDT